MVLVVDFSTKTASLLLIDVNGSVTVSEVVDYSTRPT
jgi:hypothetical protein